MNALELFMLDQQAKLGHMRACAADFERLAPATREILMPLIQAGHKGYPLAQLVGYHGCTYATWFREHGAMLEGMGYRVQQEHGATLYSTSGKVYCQVNREFVQDLALAQQMEIQANPNATRDALWL